MNTKSIVVAGVELTEIDFPHLYIIAQTNKEGLTEQLTSLDKAHGGKSDMYSTAISLENDLAHG